MLALKDRIPPSQRDSAAGDVYRLFLLVVSTSSSGLKLSQRLSCRWMSVCVFASSGTATRIDSVSGDLLRRLRSVSGAWKETRGTLVVNFERALTQAT